MSKEFGYYTTSGEVIPKEIQEAARLIDNWMTENGHRTWELMGLCSRNYAYEVHNIKRLMEQYENTDVSTIVFPSPGSGVQTTDF